MSISDSTTPSLEIAELSPSIEQSLSNAKLLKTSFLFQSLQEKRFEPTRQSSLSSRTHLLTMAYQYFLVDRPLPYVIHVQINRPSKLNSFFEAMWLEFKTVFDTLSHDPEVRAIILSGAGDRAFTAGLDVQAASQQGILQQQEGKTADVARKAVGIKRHVEEFQDCISSVEKCEKRKFYPHCDNRRLSGKLNS
jgi:hypothetical protein